ncbi:MAG: PspC domain-containing protein [Chloroflexi bacterium]|nr:PspC domain-containing protein [Chloroflexota bacterium]
MTTERADTALPNEPLATYRRLERRTSNRVIGGVAGGLADYLNVDPLLIRVGFAGLMLFSGAGIPLYLLGWLFIPLAGRPDSIAMGWLRSLAERPVTVVVLALLGILALFSFPISSRIGDWYVPFEVWVALGIALVGLFLLLPRGQAGAGVARPPAAAPPPGAPAAAADWTPPPAPAAPIPAEPVSPPSPLGWYALAAAFIGVGAVAIIDNLSTVPVELADYFGVALLALGIGLLVGALWGRARGLILIGLAILPFALGSSFVHVPLDGGVGEPYYAPESIGQLRPEYRLAAGGMIFDLTQLEGQTGALDMAASVGVGKIVVVLPQDAIIDITSSVEAGRLALFDSERVGTSLRQRVIGNGTGTGTGATMHLTLDVGIGDVFIYRSQWVDELELEGELLELERSSGG